MKENQRSSRSSSRKGRLSGASGRKGRLSGASGRRLVVGRIARAVGLRGEVEVAVESDDPRRFAVGSVVHSESKGELRVATHRSHNERTIVSFEGIADRTGAERLKGEVLTIDEGEARELEEDEYWDHELIGSTVVTVEGTEIGVVDDVLHQPAGGLLVVGGNLVPLVREIVVDVSPGRVTIDPPEGLIE